LCHLGQSRRRRNTRQWKSALQIASSIGRLMTNLVRSTYLWLPLMYQHRNFKWLLVKVDEDEGNQEGTAAQEMESLSIEAQTEPTIFKESRTSPAFTLDTFDSILWQSNDNAAILRFLEDPTISCDDRSQDQRRKLVLANWKHSLNLSDSSHLTISLSQPNLDTPIK
jgi:hypothetical protein